jgi:hypothetical protein
MSNPAHFKSRAASRKQNLELFHFVSIIRPTITDVFMPTEFPRREGGRIAPHLGGRPSLDRPRRSTASAHLGHSLTETVFARRPADHGNGQGELFLGPVRWTNVKRSSLGEFMGPEGGCAPTLAGPSPIAPRRPTPLSARTLRRPSSTVQLTERELAID